jgi:3-oxo-5-alpha-steroid 4-dehydrogenase 1
MLQGIVENYFYWLVFWAYLGFAAIAFITLYFVSAPYGRHVRAGWGPKIDATFAWVIMETPAPLLFFVYWLGAEPAHKFSAAGIAFLVLWQAHYLYRAFVFPFRRHGGQRDMPFSIALMAIFHNVMNAYLNAAWLYEIGPVYDVSWLTDPRFIAGVLLFVFGYWLNHQSDRILFNLRPPGVRNGYKIPHGGFYRFVSCPNYLGELIEWGGWALLTFSPGGLAFLLGSIANLAPRARTNHRWYREQFPDYPKERKALIPFVY